MDMISIRNLRKRWDMPRSEVKAILQSYHVQVFTIGRSVLVALAEVERIEAASAMPADAIGVRRLGDRLLAWAARQRRATFSPTDVQRGLNEPAATVRATIAAEVAIGRLVIVRPARTEGPSRGRFPAYAIASALAPDPEADVPVPAGGLAT